jgi:hypothetical protein
VSYRASAEQDRSLYVAVLSSLWETHGQPLAVEYCLGVQNNTWMVKVLKDDYTLTYWFSVLREL